MKPRACPRTAFPRGRAGRTSRRTGPAPTAAWPKPISRCSRPARRWPEVEPVVIIGSGLAGYTLARELRKLDPALPLTILSRDEASFYSKPMLSTALASGKAAGQLAGAGAAQMAA